MLIEKRLLTGIVIAIALVILLLWGEAGADSSFEFAISMSQKGDLYFGEGNYSAALEAYNLSLMLDPYNALVWGKYGETLERLGRFNESITAFDKAILLDPYFVKALINKGDALAETGDIEGAITTYNMVLALNPNDIHSLVRKGIGLEQTGQADGARKAYEEAIRIADREVRIHPNDAKYDADLWNERGNALFRLGKYEEALQSYNQAIGINPKHEEAIRNRNMILLKIFELKSAPPGLPPFTPGLISTTTKSPFPYFSAIVALVAAALVLFLREAG